MAIAIDRYKTIILTQGGADAFVEGEILTLLVPEQGLGWKLNRIVFQFGDALSALSADCSIGWSVTRDSKTGVVGYSDADTVYHDGFNVSLTTSGQIVIPYSHIWLPPDNTIFVEPTIYFQLDSTTTGLANVAAVRLHYEEIKVSEIDILRLLQNA